MPHHAPLWQGLGKSENPKVEASTQMEGNAVIRPWLCLFDGSGSSTYLGRPRRRLHSPRAERMKVKPPSPPSAQSVQTKKKPPGDLAISL
jgi:hypothetical protein